MADQVRHRGVLSPTLSKIDQLVVQITGRFTRDAREVAVVGRAALLTVAGNAGLHPLGH